MPSSYLLQPLRTEAEIRATTATGQLIERREHCRRYFRWLVNGYPWDFQTAERNALLVSECKKNGLDEETANEIIRWGGHR